MEVSWACEYLFVLSAQAASKLHDISMYPYGTAQLRRPESEGVAVCHASTKEISMTTIMCRMHVLHGVVLFWCVAGMLNKRQIALGLFDQIIHTSAKADTRRVYADVVSGQRP